MAHGVEVVSLHIKVNPALNGSTQQAKAAVGEHVVEGEVQFGVSRKDFAFRHFIPVLAGKRRRDVFEADGDHSVNGGADGAQVGAVALTEGAGFESDVVGGQRTAQGERPVHGLAAGGECTGNGVWLAEQHCVRVVHGQRRRRGVPRHGEPR